MATDPVCGMTVDPRAKRGSRVEHGGTTYYFCSKGCVAKFQADPERYSSGTREPHQHRGRVRGTRATDDRWVESQQPPSPQPPAPSLQHLHPAPSAQRPGVLYICPMHPEVTSDRPGAVPEVRHGARALITDLTAAETRRTPSSST